MSRPVPEGAGLPGAKVRVRLLESARDGRNAPNTGTGTRQRNASQAPPIPLPTCTRVEFPGPV